MLASLFVSIFALNVVHSRDCGVQVGEARASSLSIALQREEPNRCFYLRSGHYVILVDRKVFIAHLEAKTKNVHENSNRQFLNLAERAAKVNWPVDAVSLAFQNPLLLQKLDHAFADILQSGKATVIDLHSLPSEAERIVPSVSMASIADGAYASRAFCTESGDRLLKVVDSIE